jgi:hypothetical protein
MQAYITRSLYHGEDSLGAQARRATAEAKKLKDENGGPDLLPRIGKRAKAKETTAVDTTTVEATAAETTTATPSAKANGQGSNAGGQGSNANGQGPVAPTSRTAPANRSKKKKKRK